LDINVYIFTSELFLAQRTKAASHRAAWGHVGMSVSRNLHWSIPVQYENMWVTVFNSRCHKMYENTWFFCNCSGAVRSLYATWCLYPSSLN